MHKFAGESFSKMLQSPYFSKHLVLKAREHGYVEGSQHLRPTRYKQSQYDTSIIILQSKTAKQWEAKEKNLKSHDLESKLREAFSTNHLQELFERRKGNESQPSLNQEISSGSMIESGQESMSRKKTKRRK